MGHLPYSKTSFLQRNKFVFEYLLKLSIQMRERLGVTWCVSETGAAGPTFHPATGATGGFSIIAVAGPGTTARAGVVYTGHQDRERNMKQFAAAALEFLRLH